MMDPVFTRDTAHYRPEEELMHEAEQERLAARAHADEPSLPDRLLLEVGDALVNTGLQLREWYMSRRLHQHWAREESMSHP